MKTVSWPGNISIKFLLAKITFVLNSVMLSAQLCRRSVLIVFLDVVLLFRCSPGVLLFHFSVTFQLFRHRSVVPPVFRSCAIVPVFRHCSGVPCSGVPGFIVCPIWGLIAYKPVAYEKTKCTCSEKKHQVHFH